MKHITGTILMLLLLGVFLTGAAAAEETRTFTDDVGRTITVPTVVDAVSPSGPLAQIVLYSMSPDCFVSVSSKLSENELKYLDSRLATLPVTGQFYGTKSTMNAEEIMELNKKLNIDLVLDLGGVKKNMADDLTTIQTQTGVNFAFITQDNLSDIAPFYIKLGNLLGMNEQGQKLSTYVTRLLAETDAGLKKVGDKKVSMIYVTKVDGNAVSMIGSGANSYHGEVINLVANNLAPTAVTGSGTGDGYTMEDILKLDPDYIIVGYTSDHAYYNEIMNSAQWKSLRAVKNGNVYESPSGPYSWMGNPPSVHKLLSLIWLENLFYPDVFTFDLQTKVTEFYSLFFHHDLTAAEYSELTPYAVKTAASATPTKTPVPFLGILAGFAAAGVVVLRRR